MLGCEYSHTLEVINYRKQLSVEVERNETQKSSIDQGLQRATPQQVDLPEGWEATQTEQGRIFYVDHKNKKTSWVNPRLLAEQSDLPEGAPANVEPETLSINETTEIRSAILDGNVDGDAQLVERVDLGAALFSATTANATLSDEGCKSIHIQAGRGRLRLLERLLRKGVDPELRTDSRHTPLHFAALKGQLAVVDRLFMANVDVNVQADCGTSPLHLAAMHGHLEVVDRLLGQGANAEVKSKNGRTPLDYAALGGHLAVVERLFETGINAQAQADDGNSSLHWAVSKGCVPVVARLLQANFDPETPSVEGKTAIHVAALYGHADVVALLVPWVDIGIQDKNGWTALHFACGSGNVKAVELLSGPGRNVNQQSKIGDTPLRIAAARGDSATVKYLLSLGANPDSRSFDGTRPIHGAAQNNHLAVIEQLLQAGANPTNKLADGRTPLTLAAQDGHVAVVERLLRSGAGVMLNSPEGSTLLYDAVRAGQCEMVDLLLGLGADPNISKDNLTPLHLAANAGPVAIVEALLRAEADPDSPGLDGKTPLHFAAQNGNLDAVHRLVEAGADVEALSSDCRTPAHYAAMKGELAVVQELSNARADLEARAAIGGYSLIHTAAAGGNLAVIDFLLERGVPVDAVADGGLTVLHYAGGSLAITKRLLEAGVDPSSRTHRGNTAFDLAQTAGHLPVMRLLRRVEMAVDYWRDNESVEGSFFMNLLPKIGNATYFMEIPFLCADKDYDNLGFSGFPERMGWKTSASVPGEPFIRADSIEKTKEEYASFLQAWLFFGMLSDILNISGVTLKTEDFVRWKAGRLIITTDLLPRYLDQWAAHEKSFSTAVQGIHIGQFDAVLETACDFTDENLSWEGRNTASCPLSHEVSISILLLGQCLASARNRVWDKQIRIQRDSQYTLANFSQRSKFQADMEQLEDEKYPVLRFQNPGKFTCTRMKTAGWCRSEIMMLHRNLTSTSLYLISMLARPAMKTQHSSCSENQCFATQIDDKDYETKHTEDCRQCSLVEVDTVEVSRILSKGRIPSVVIDVSTKHKAVSLRVVDDEDHGYVAVSHVWSHGLGNVDGNSLPRCQLLRLKELTDALYNTSRDGNDRTVSLWIDTLCIPRAFEGRKLALKMLRKSFEKADKVLVLDTELQNATSLTTDVEILARVLFCGWLRRLWTLEEALVARNKLRVQFREGAIDVYSRMDSVVQEFRKSPSLHYCGCLDIIKALDRFAPNDFENVTSGRGLEFLGLALQYRTTSKSADEILCLASLLRLDVARLFQTPIESRTELFYTLLGKNKSIPSSILFVDGPRLEVDGYRWAPPTFLTRSLVDIFDLHLSTPPAAGCDESGLRVTFPGWVLQHQDVSLTSNFCFEDRESGDWFYVATAEKTEAWDRFGLGKHSKIALLYSPWSVSKGVLVSIQRLEGEILYAKFLWRVEVYQTQADEPFSPVKALQKSDEQMRNYWEVLGKEDMPTQGSTLASVRRVLPTQMWCIG